ncbi:MAG: UDP-glucose 4-epimerase GalE [Clostridiales bacterium]|jgi:UDP-glucose 4-epimerase|nr:UDP-glucose 4-epimerase GalE [Clostridiales bacterium]
MTVLVTGGAGFIGTHICVELLMSGHGCIAADNLSNSCLEAVKRVEEIAGRILPFYEIDVRDEDKLDIIFKEHAIDAVIHLAGLKAVGESVSMPLEYYSCNLNVTLSVLKAMKKNNVKSFVFSSSATVYSAGNSMPLAEEAACGGCSNPYGWTKFMGEIIARDAAHAYPEMSVVLLRYFNPIGAHESGRIGEDPLGIPNNLVPFISQTAIGKREKVMVYGNDYDTPDGTGVRDYLHVVDLAKAHIAAVDYSVKHRGVEVFNLGTGKGASVLEIIEAYRRVNSVEIPYEIAGRRPGDLAVCFADPAKARRVLAWRAERNLDEMVRDSYRWQKSNPNGYHEDGGIA